MRIRRLACSFCGATADEVARLVAGPPGLFICDGCVAHCNEILARHPVDPAASRASATERGRLPRWRRLLAWRTPLRASTVSHA